MIPERWQVWLLAGTILCSGIAVAGGVFLGGYALGEQPAPPPPTELAEKTYTIEDLEAALAACEIEGVAVEDSAVTLVGADHPSQNRQCFVAEMRATELADREYAGVLGTRVPDEGEYAWSNVTMSWQQAEVGRDVTITVR